MNRNAVWGSKPEGVDSKEVIMVKSNLHLDRSGLSKVRAVILLDCFWLFN